MRNVFSYGGDFATGSGGIRAGTTRLVESCALNGKWITSFAAIVAPQTCDLVRGALVLVAPARPAIHDLDFLTRLGLLFFRPWPQYFALLYSLASATSPSVQYVIWTLATTSTKGAGTNFL
jgi:hypothetical protein